MPNVELVQVPLHDFKYARHYFIRVDEPYVEIHPGTVKGGGYRNAKVHKDEVIVYKKELCADCYQKLLDESYWSFSVWYFPLVNCEIISRSLIGWTPISPQNYIIAAGILITLIGVVGHLILALISFILTTILLIYWYGRSLPTQIAKCQHLEESL